MKDEWAIVLDFLPRGTPGPGKPEPVAQALGEMYFSILEIVPRDGVEFSLGDRIYIGEGEREQVKYIKKAIAVDDLSAQAKNELEEVIKDLISENEERFIDFFNKSQSISTRMHSLELLPGIGKKHMWEILEARREKLFDNYKDLKTRCPSIPDPVRMIEKRIIEEINGEDERHRIFVLKPQKRRD